MSPPFPARPVALIAALGAAGAEWSLTAQAGLEPFLALPLAIATGASVIWAGLALDALVRRRARPDRDDIRAVVTLQRENEGVIADQAARLARVETVLAFLRADPALSDAEHALAQAARAVETWEGLSVTLPVWMAARDRWAAIVEPLAPHAVADLDRVGDDETRIARERLPITQNLSSRDLKAATVYLVHAKQWVSAHEALQAHRRHVFDTTSR